MAGVGVGIGRGCGGRGGSRDRREVWWQGWEQSSS